MLNNYFDKIYCINLDEAVDRWIDCVKQSEKFGFKMERFSAIKPEDGMYSIPIGHVGVIRSNIELLRRAKRDNLNNVLILEDDFLFVDNFNELFESTYPNIPNNWDFIYFGGNHLGPLNRIGDNIYKMTHTYAIHTVAIKNTMYDKIINKLTTEEKPGDVSYAELMPSCNAYVIMPHLSTQKAGFSYIENEYRNYDYCLKR